MKRYATACCLLAGLLLPLLLGRPGRAQKPAPAPTELTIYQNDFAMVHEARDMQVAAGASTLLVDHVSHSLDPGSLLLSFAGAQAPRILGQGYELGVSDVREVLRRRVGQEVDWVRFRPDGKVGRRDKARLLAVDENGKTVIESGGRIYTDPPGQLALDPQGAASAGRLALQVDSQRAGQASLDLGYLTRDMGWRSDYVLTLDAAQPEVGRLEAVGAVTNKTGVAFDRAQVTLVAGEPNRAAVAGVTEGWVVGGMAGGGGRQYYAVDGIAPRAAEPKAEPKMGMVDGAGPRSVGEQQSYPIARPVDIASDRLTRLPMFSAERVKVVRDFSYTAPLLGPWTSVPTRTARATLALALRNNRDSGLGLALPAGTLRAFERDAQHRLQYVGASELKMLSPDERADLTLGTAFDLRIDYRCWGVNRADNGRWRATIEMTVTSTRATDTVVRLVQPFDTGNIVVTSGDRPGQWLNSRRAEWTLTVPHGGSSGIAVEWEFGTGG